VFEETSDNRSNAHSFGSARNSRPQAAKAANNQVDRDASLGSVTQSLDHVRIFQLVHLGDDSSRAAGAMILHLPADQFQQPRPHRLGGHQEGGALRSAGMAGEVVEKVKHVMGEHRVARK
jgi:hypothetical protein